MWTCACWTLIWILCGTSQPRDLLEQTGGEKGRFLMDTVSLKSYSRPVVHWRQVPGRDVLTMCVFISPVAETHTEGWVTAAVPGSNTSSGLCVYHQAWCFISTGVLCSQKNNSDMFDEKVWDLDVTESFKLLLHYGLTSELCHLTFSCTCISVFVLVFIEESNKLFIKEFNL